MECNDANTMITVSTCFRSSPCGDVTHMSPQSCGTNDQCLCDTATITAITSCQQCMFNDLVAKFTTSMDPRAGSATALTGELVVLVFLSSMFMPRESLRNGLFGRQRHRPDIPCHLDNPTGLGWFLRSEAQHWGNSIDFGRCHSPGRGCSFAFVEHLDA